MKKNTQNMFYRMLAVVLVFNMLLPSQFGFAATQPTITVNKPFVDEVNNTVKVSGTISSGAGKRITVLIKKPGASQSSTILEEIAFNMGQNLSTSSGVNGYFELSFPVRSTAPSGTYQVLVGGTKVNEPTVASFKYFNPQDTADVLQKINNASADSIMSEIIQNNDLIGVDLSLYDSELLPTAAKAKVREALAASTFAGLSEFFTAYENNIAICAVNVSTTSTIISVINLYQDILALPYSGDYLLLSTAGQQAAQKALATKAQLTPFKTPDEIVSAFRQAILSEIQAETIVGDVNGDQVIDARDAFALKKSLPTSQSFNTKQKIACDVSGDLLFNNDDVNEILKIVVKIKASSYATVSDPVFQSGDPTIKIDNVTGNSGQEISVPIYADVNVNAAGLQFVVTYDPAVLSLSTSPLNLLDASLRGYMWQVNQSESGKIYYTFINDSDVTVKNIGSLKFYISTSAAATTSIAVDKILVFNQNQTRVAVKGSTGSITVTQSQYSAKGGGGSSAPVVVTPTAIPTAAPTAAPEVSVPFDDLGEVVWAKESIVNLYEKGIIAGVGDRQFKPQDKVTREQFVKMLVQAFAFLDDKAKTSFSDVDPKDWSYPYIASAQKYGIVTGTTEGTFGLGKEITREEMAVLADRAAAKAGIKLPARTSGDDFKDKTEISSYAMDSIQGMKKAGIMNGIGDQRFAPKETTTRAMAAKVIYGLIQLK